EFINDKVLDKSKQEILVENRNTGSKEKHNNRPKEHLEEKCSEELTSMEPAKAKKIAKVGSYYQNEIG
ncbi:46358_t:CDS:2, partial [Gigaspora margarita]